MRLKIILPAVSVMVAAVLAMGYLMFFAGGDPATADSLDPDSAISGEVDLGDGETVTGGGAGAGDDASSPTPTPTALPGVLSRDGFVGGNAYGVSLVQSVRRDATDHQGWVDLTLLLMVTSFDTDPSFKPSAALRALPEATGGENELCFTPRAGEPDCLRVNWGSEEQFTGSLAIAAPPAGDWHTNKAHPYAVQLEIPANAERAGLVFGGTRIPLDLGGDPVRDFTGHTPTLLEAAPRDKGAPAWTDGYWLASGHGVAVRGVSREALDGAPGWARVHLDLAVAVLGEGGEDALPITTRAEGGSLCLGPEGSADCLRVLWGSIYQFDAELALRESPGTRPWPRSRSMPLRVSFLVPSNATNAAVRFGAYTVPVDLRASAGPVPLWDYLTHHQELKAGSVLYDSEAQVITLTTVSQDPLSGDLTLTFSTSNDKENADFFPRVEAAVSRVAVDGTVFDGLTSPVSGWKPVTIRAQGATLAPGQRGEFVMTLPRVEGQGFDAPAFDADADARPDAVLISLRAASAPASAELPEDAAVTPTRYISFIRAESERALWFPDLRAIGVGMTPAKPTAGDAVELVITVRNDGPRPAAASTAQVHVGQTLLATLNVPALAAGASVALRTPWTASASDETIRVVVNASGAVEEPSTAGNDVSFTMPASPLPDLVISDVRFGVAARQLGEEVTVSVTVTNRGAGRARGSRVQAFLGGSSKLAFFLSYPALAPGESATAQFTWKASDNPYAFHFVADGYGDVPESDDTNNEAEAEHAGTLLPDLHISPTYVLDNPAGGAFFFGLVVVNSGSGRSPAGKMMLYLDGATTHASQVDIPVIEAGASAEVTITASAPAGQRAVLIKVDGADAHPEEDETNNTFHFSFLN